MTLLRFVLNPEKAGQAAARLLRTHAAPVSRFFLIKWLYLADRESLIQRGQPITGDAPWCLPDGPILSTILNYLNGHDGEPPREWSANVQQVEWNAYVAAPSAADDLLSPAETRILDAVHAQHGNKSFDELWIYTHTRLPEYVSLTGSSRRKPLDYRVVLRAAGVPEDHIAAIERDAALERALAQSAKG